MNITHLDVEESCLDRGSCVGEGVQGNIQTGVRGGVNTGGMIERSGAVDGRGGSHYS